MFRGIAKIALDTKGRVSVPTRYRALLTEAQDRPVVLTIDTDAPCLLLYPLAEWEVIEKKLVALPSFNPIARRIQRLLIGHASEIHLDNQGRLLISPELRDYAQLEKDCMLVGQGQRFELWSLMGWERARAEWLATDLGQSGDMPAELKELQI